jgi:DnaD/phage-associated family protein
MSQKYDLLSSATAPIMLRVIPELAEEIGLNPSLVLLQLTYWIRISDNERDGRNWTFQSLRGMKRAAFPFWSVMTIDRAIQQLVKRDLVIVRDDLNKRKGDNTRWFALNPDGLAKLHSVSLQTLNMKRSAKVSQNETVVSQVDTPASQDVTTLPETTPETTQKEQQPPQLVVIEKPRPNVFGMYEEAFGMTLTRAIADRLKEMAETYTEDWVGDALKITATSGHRGSLQYTDGILRRWQREGRTEKKDTAAPAIETPEQAAAREAKQAAREKQMDAEREAYRIREGLA